MSFSAHDRGYILTRLREEEFDILIVGGGITGAGVARDAALRGLRVALVEANDFASGTSSRSSRLVHGGLRYLENYEFKLVFESTHERARLMRLAPHLVRPLPFLLPVYAGTKPGPGLLRAGMWLYDLLATFRNYRRHRKLSPSRVATDEPTLLGDGLRAAFRYYDCITNDGRLTLENVLGAVEAGAVCLSYARFEAPLWRDSQVTGAEIVDQETGERVSVRARVIINAVGPWLNDVRGRFGETAGPSVVPSKGVHLVLPRERLPTKNAIVMSAVRDGRVVFCVPWGSATYVGTTDTAFDGDPDEVHADSDDVAYLLETANHYFPGQRLVPEDVISSWAGLRPLVADDVDARGSHLSPLPSHAGEHRTRSATYETSREHIVQSDPAGVVTVSGGKLTTYRIMARETLDAAIVLLRGRGNKQAIGRCSTAKRPLPGGVGLGKRKARQAFLAEQRARVPLDDDIFEHLFATYGARLPRLLDAIEKKPSFAERIEADLPYIWAELAFAAEEEMLVHLDDLLLRRTFLLFVGRRQGRAAAPEIARRLGALLGWDDRRITEELERIGRAAIACTACVT